MEWIHCNNCCRQPRSRDCEFFITNCGHIFCKRCLESRENLNECLVCKAKCRTTPLGRDLRPEIRMYFEDLERKLNELSALASSLSSIAKFQKGHRANLFKKQTRMFDTYKHLKQENDLLRKKLVDIQKENQALRRKEQISQRTPIVVHDNELRNNPRYSHALSSASLNPRTPGQDVFDNSRAAFQFIQPHLKNNVHYRNNSQRTPAYDQSTGGSAASSNFANQLHRQVASSGFARPRETPDLKVPQKGPTPLYNALRVMKINNEAAAARRVNRK